QTPLLNVTNLIGIDDLDGDGTLDVVASSVDHVFVINGKTGAVEWAEPDGEMGTLGSVRLADVNGDGKPEILNEECGCCAPNSGNTGYTYSFAAGFKTPTLLWKLPSTYCGAYNSLTIVNLDGNGHMGVLNADNAYLMMLDGITGNKLAQTWAITNYISLSSCLAKDVDGVPGDEMLCFANSSAGPGLRRLYLLKYDGTATPPTLNVA